MTAIDSRIEQIEAELAAVRKSVERLEKSQVEKDKALAEIRHDVNRAEMRRKLWGK